MRSGLFVVLGIIALTGCAMLDRSRVVLDVPFVAQEDDHCGATSLFMVLQYHGCTVDYEHLKQMMYIPALGGTITGLLIEGARKHGAEADVEHGNLESLKKWLQRGIPPIVLLKQEENSEKGHFAVVVGMRNDGKKMCIHIWSKAFKWYETKEFMKSWKNGDFTAVLVER
jgi:ABC-type bacteriocin/lantibiotic exporter with double-glycine peptidase domain